MDKIDAEILATLLSNEEAEWCLCNTCIRALGKALNLAFPLFQWICIENKDEPGFSKIEVFSRIQKEKLE